MVNIKPTQEGAQNFTGASRGATGFSQGVKKAANTSSSENVLAGVVGLVGDAFNLTAKAVDDSNQRTHREKLREKIDETNEAFNISNIANLVESESGVTPPILPDEITRSGEQLKGMTQAVRANRMRNSHYWARVNQIAKTLRHRYPAYRDQIDQMTSAMVGTNPANALRSALAAEARQASKDAGKLTAEQKFLSRQDVLENLPSHIVADANNNPDQWPLSRLQVEMSSRLNRKTQDDVSRRAMQDEILRHKLGDSRREQAKRNLGDVLNQELSLIVSDATGAITSNIKKDGVSLQQMIRDAQNVKPEDVSGEQITAMRQSFAQIRFNMETQMERIMSDPAYALLDPEQRERAKTLQMGQMNALEKALNDKDFGAFNIHQSSIAAQSNADGATLSREPAIRTLSAVQSRLGPQMASTFLGLNPRLIKDVDLGIRNSKLVAMINGNSTLADAVDSSKRDHRINGETTEGRKYYKSLMDQVVEGLTNRKMPRQDQENLIRSVYGPGNESLLEQTTDHAFFTLSNDKIAKRVRELSENDPELWRNYKKWTLDSASALGKTLADSVKEIRVNRKFFDVEFDNNQFNLVPIVPKGDDRLTAGGTQIVDLTERLFSADVQVSVDKFNEYLRAVDSVFKLDGGDTGKFMDTIMASNFNFDVSETRKEEPSLQWFLQRARGFFGAIDEEDNRAQNQ